jgi:hypothetical protein
LDDLNVFLKDLQTAYMTGATQVTFQGMTTIYNSASELRRKINEIQAEIDSRNPSNTGKKRTKRVYIQTDSRGF